MSSSNTPEPTFSGAGAGESCAALFINTTLASPDPDVIEGIEVDDILEIIAETNDGPIQAITSDGNVAGNIVSSRYLLLLKCLQDGVRYTAKVTSHDDGAVNVLIRPV